MRALHASVDAALRGLPPRDEQLLRMCFGLGAAVSPDDWPGFTDTPSERRRLIAQALRRLRLAALRPVTHLH